MRTKSKDISKRQKVLNHLERYGSINKQTALALFKVWDLSNMIVSVRKKLPDGYTVKCVNKYTDDIKYVLYNPQGEPVFSRFIKQKHTA